MSEVITGLIGIGLGGWLVLTILTQFRNKVIHQWIYKWDIFLLVPLWTFFSPRAGRDDYLICYRKDTTMGLVSSEWVFLDCKPERDWWNFIWRPNKRASKAIYELVQVLLQANKGLGEASKSVQTHIGYLVFLSMCVHDAKVRSNFRQDDIIRFAILSSSGRDHENTLKPVFVSHLHRIDRSDD